MNTIIKSLPKSRSIASTSLVSAISSSCSRCLTSSAKSSNLESSTSASTSPQQQTATSDSVSDENDVIDSESFQEPQISEVKYPYYVSRAGVYSDSLPVYTDIRHGGQSVFTVLRRVQGNVEALRHDLETSLPSLLIPEPVPVRGSKARAGRTLEPSHPTKAQPVKSSKVGAVGKIVITGDRRREVREWLEERGF